MNKGECSKCGKTVIESTLENGVCLSCRYRNSHKHRKQVQPNHELI